MLTFGRKVNRNVVSLRSGAGVTVLVDGRLEARQHELCEFVTCSGAAGHRCSMRGRTSEYESRLCGHHERVVQRIFGDRRGLPVLKSLQLSLFGGP